MIRTLELIESQYTEVSDMTQAEWDALEAHAELEKQEFWEQQRVEWIGAMEEYGVAA